MIPPEWAFFETRAKALLELLDLAIASTHALHARLDRSWERTRRREAARKRAAIASQTAAPVSGKARRRRARSQSAAG